MEDIKKLIFNILYEHTDHNTMTIGEIEFEDIVNEIAEKIKNAE